MPVSISLTTGEAARYCHVSQATIVNWIRKGKLKAYITPGGHHRILLPDFVSFLEAYDIPVDAALRTASRPLVLVVSDNPHTAQLARDLGTSAPFEVAVAGNGHEAGAQVARLEPDVVVLDATSSELDWLELCRWLRDSSDGRSFSILTMGGPENELAARTAGADAHLTGIATISLLEAELETLIERNGAGRK